MKIEDAINQEDFNISNKNNDLKDYYKHKAKKHKCCDNCYWYSQCQTYLDKEETKYIKKYGCGDYDPITEDEHKSEQVLKNLVESQKQKFRYEWSDYLTKFYND